ncbi:alpha-amylase family glycosyl hydrolase [Amphibacillus sp. Q70]|uniref:alpha-amylase family glycosyl hydrolase n=1 Tax=Amphibacillus sp. Q70 TaxID=3453416 RepID=UPI003F87C601
MKKSLLLSMILILGMLLFACSPEEDEAATDDEGENEENTAEDESVELVDLEQNIDWAQESIFYQVFVRSFYDGDGDGIGDFAGLEEKLPYIQELGANAIWLMPINEAASYHGYDATDYYNVEPDYGTMEEFESLIEAAHDLDMKVIIDFVANHTSSEHEWFQEALENPDSPYRDYYIWDDHESYQGQEPNGEFGWHEANDQIYSAHFNVDMPDLNYDHPEVREEIKSVASFWLDKGVDGFRLDAVSDIYEDRNQTIEWWRDFNAHVKAEDPEAFIVGETWYHNWNDISFYYSAHESNFNFVLTEEIIGMANGVARDIVAELEEAHQLYQGSSNPRGDAPVIDSTMIGNHDMDRIMTRLDGDENKAKLAANLLFTLPGTPFIYYGDELGQEGQRPDDHRREPFDWYANAEGEGMTVMDDHFFSESAFTHPNDGISLEEQEGNQDSMYEHYKTLIQIRRDHPMLFTGDYESFDTEFGTYGYTVNDDDTDDQLAIVHNQRDEMRTVNVVADDVTELFSGEEYNDGDVIELAPYHSIILLSDQETIPIEEVEPEVPDQDYTVTFQVSVPEDTPDEDIYLVGEFNEWNEADEEMILEQIDDHLYEISIDGQAFEMVEYKFTRGSWDRREQNSAGQDLIGERQTDNRLYTFEQDDHVEEIIIERWSDQE